MSCLPLLAEEVGFSFISFEGFRLLLFKNFSPLLMHRFMHQALSEHLIYTSTKKGRTARLGGWKRAGGLHKADILLYSQLHLQTIERSLAHSRRSENICYWNISKRSTDRNTGANDNTGDSECVAQGACFYSKERDEQIRSIRKSGSVSQPRVVLGKIPMTNPR